MHLYLLISVEQKNQSTLMHWHAHHSIMFVRTHMHAHTHTCAQMWNCKTAQNGGNVVITIIVNILADARPPASTHESVNCQQLALWLNCAHHFATGRLCKKGRAIQEETSKWNALGNKRHHRHLLRSVILSAAPFRHSLKANCINICAHFIELASFLFLTLCSLVGFGSHPHIVSFFCSVSS